MKVQKKAVGMVSGLKGKSYEERCAELGLETLETRKIKQEAKNCSQQQADMVESVQDGEWAGSTICQYGHPKILVCSTDSGALE